MASRFVVPAGDAEALRGAATLMAEPETAHSMGVAGREWVRSRFSSDRLVDEMIALYEELMDGRK